MDLGRKYKLRMLFCSACLGKLRVGHRKFWRSLRNASLGKPRVHAKCRSKNERPTSDTIKASRKYRWIPRRCTFRYGRNLWLHRCRQHCTWTRVTKRMRKYSRILNLRTLRVCLFSITRMMIEGNSEIKTIFRRCCELTVGKIRID